MTTTEKNLSTSVFLNGIKTQLKQIKDYRNGFQVKYPLHDVLMSGIALFGLKMPSLLQFIDSYKDNILKENLNNLYGIDQVPSDSSFREILDEVSPKDLSGSFKDVFSKLQSGKALNKFLSINNTYLMSVDGSGYFSSHEIHCDNCGVKKHRDGSITYHHEMLAAVIVNPDIKQVIPLKPEPIIKQDGSSKNDCEINAVKRLLSDVRKDHSQLKITMVADGLYGKSTIIDMCRDLKYDFIIGAKPGDHVHLFEQFNSLNKSKDTNKLEIIENGVERTFEFVNNLELNKSNPDVKINFLFFVEKKKGKTIYFTWITSHLITQDNVYTIMRAGRARWKIENETFNTLKNKGYQFEHNFGHGYKHLSSVLACLMMLAFLIDQAQEITSQVVKKAIQLAERKCEFWKALKAYTFTQIFKTWDELYGVILQRFIDRRAFNTS